MSKFKRFLKKIFPANWRTQAKWKKQLDKEIKSLANQNEFIINEIKELKMALSDLEILERKLVESIVQCENNIMCEMSNESKIIQSGLNKYVVDISQKNIETGEKVRTKLLEIGKQVRELNWAHIFEDTIAKSEWLMNKSFSAGRWAVGYQYLYCLYRVLNEFKPKSILELGLGQSTRMIGQYAAANDDVAHIVCEHDFEWIEFFKSDFSLSDNSEIIQFQLTTGHYKDDEAVIMYKDFKKTLKNKQFDFISIDGPFGYLAKKYSRVDVLKLLPGCLSNEFIIMIDDFDRPGEQETVKVLKSILNEANIDFAEGQYVGEKTTKIITSKHKRFLCSM